MQNYERLIIDLLPANLTPKAKYEFLQHLLWTKKVHTAAKEKLEFDLDYFGHENIRYHDAKRTYDILTGLESQPEETKKSVKREIEVDINYDLHEGRGENNELL